MIARNFLSGLAVAVACGTTATADDIRYYQDGGVTYREVRRVVQRPVVETKLEQRQQTVYQPQYTTEVVPTTSTVYTPVTEYRWEARWHNTWNPFSDPYVAYHLVPTTRWDSRAVQGQQTVTRYNVVPQTQTVQVPVTTQRVVNEEIVSRMPVQAPPAGAVVSTASGQAVGGITKLENDPPRDTGWRSGQPSVNR